MEDLLHQIRQALDANLYYVALFTTLSLPDICAALENPDGRTTGDRYEKWFDQHVGPRYAPNFSGLDCYRFRCSMLHQGTTQPQNPNPKYARVLFIEPNNGQHFIADRNVLNGAYNIDVRMFCEDMISAVVTWLKEKQDDATFARNYHRSIKRYPNGLPPYIVGIPVIS